MGKVIMSGIVPTLTAPVVFKGDSVFSNNDWATIIETCQKNVVPDTWKVGDSKSMTINGISYTVDIIGKNHDVYSDGSGTAPLTFQMHDCYTTQTVMNSSSTNSGGWKNCAMRVTHLPAILALMPNEVKSGVKEVNKLTSAGNQSTSIDTTADKLFLLSEIEVFGSINRSASGEGKQYDYYAAGNSKMKYKDGTLFGWWERSPSIANTNYFCYVNRTPTADHYGANTTFGISFAFCF